MKIVPRLLKYDFVVAQDDLWLGYLVSMGARLLRKNTRWFHLAMTSSTLIRRHAKHPVRLFLLKRFWSSYARIICLSREQIEDLARIGVPRASLVFVPYGVDTEFFKPTNPSHEGGLIVSVGRDAGRDYATLLKAASNTTYEYSIVAGHKNIPPHTAVPGNVSIRYNRPPSEVRDLYERARIVVVVSKAVTASEGSDCSGQTAILDALAAGKTVIATRRPWIEEYLTPGEDLVVVEPGGPEAIARAIRTLWDDASQRRDLAMAGHRVVTERYSTKNFAQALVGLMRNTL